MVLLSRTAHTTHLRFCTKPKYNGTNGSTDMDKYTRIRNQLFKPSHGHYATVRVLKSAEIRVPRRAEIRVPRRERYAADNMMVTETDCRSECS